MAEELNRAGMACRTERGAGEVRFRDARRYTGRAELAEDVLYVVSADDAARFPADRACVSAAPVPGGGGRLLCPDRGACVNYDPNLAASTYLTNDLEMLDRIW